MSSTDNVVDGLKELHYGKASAMIGRGEEIGQSPEVLRISFRGRRLISGCTHAVVPARVVVGGAGIAFPGLVVLTSGPNLPGYGTSSCAATVVEKIATYFGHPLLRIFNYGICKPGARCVAVVGRCYISVMKRENISMRVIASSS